MELPIKARKEAEKWMLGTAGQQHCIMHESIAFLLSESFDKLPFLFWLLLPPQGLPALNYLFLKAPSLVAFAS